MWYEKIGRYHTARCILRREEARFGWLARLNRKVFGRHRVSSAMRGEEGPEALDNRRAAQSRRNLGSLCGEGSAKGFLMAGEVGSAPVQRGGHRPSRLHTRVREIKIVFQCSADVVRTQPSPVQQPSFPIR